MARRATLKDVARAAGVSVTTVSLVLNGRPARVSKEKRELIAKAAKELHYVPNQSARSLVTKQSKLVALIVPDIENLFFAALSKCVEDECAAQGYSLIVANSDDSRATEHDLMARLASRGVDGMMLIPARESCAAEDELRADVEQVACRWCSSTASYRTAGAMPSDSTTMWAAVSPHGTCWKAGTVISAS